MLHITNGDVAAARLRASGLTGDVAIVADVLHEGPCPTDAEPTDWREARARYLADRGYATYDEALERLVDADAALHAARAHDEVVLWFEHDLFDQLLLVRALAWFARYGLGGARLSIVCIGEHPAVARFQGLGQLSGPQLAALWPTRTPVTAAHTAVAADTWRRVGAADPTGLAAILAEDTSALPFLAAAIRRLLEEYPSTRNGLSRSEHQALAAISAGAPDLTTAFRSTQEMEERVFMGDTTFLALVRALAETAVPLVRLDPPGDHVPATRQAAILTPFGREVLAGHADHAGVNGLDRWVGGVCLRGRSPQWRWDPRKESIVAGGTAARP